LPCGMINKKSVGNQEGSLMHVIMMEYGHEMTQNFFHNVQKISNQWLVKHSYTIGMGDMIADDKTMGRINTTIETAKKDMVLLSHILITGTSLKASGLLVLKSTASVHPHDACRVLETKNWLERLRKLAEFPDVVAVGECGLDYN
ncbi:DNA-directed RNA polymerase II subunit RPB1-like, partial [Planoprotostelium fungivorum]